MFKKNKQRSISDVLLEEVERGKVSVTSAEEIFRQLYSQPSTVLEWAHWPWERCRAVRELRHKHGGPGPVSGSGRGAVGKPIRGQLKGQVYGRCELKRGHKGLHALDRGFDIPRWSTDWVDHG